MVFCLFLHNNHFVIGIFELIYKLVRQKKRHSNLSCINPRQLADISRRPKQCTCQANILWSSYMMIRFFFYWRMKFSILLLYLLAEFSQWIRNVKFLYLYYRGESNTDFGKILYLILIFNIPTQPKQNQAREFVYLGRCNLIICLD